MHSDQDEGVNVSGPQEIVLHIGPPKTASTTVQRRLAEQREGLAAEGIDVIVEHRDAAIELIGHDYLNRRRQRTTHAWKALQEAVQSANGNRVLISNEMFAWLNQTNAEELINVLGKNSLRVVFGIRLMENLVSSFWHEVIIRGGTCTLAEWIQEIRSVDGHIGNLDDSALRFWHSEDAATLARRWAEVIGHDRVTCVVISERDPSITLGRFDEALGLSSTKILPVTRVENKSSSQAHFDALVRFNRSVARMGISNRYRLALARFAHEQLLTRHDLPRDTPWLSREDRAWCAQRQSRMVDELSALGINVVGDFRDLAVSDRELTGARPRGEGVRVNLLPIASRVIRGLLRRLSRKPYGASEPH